MMRIMTLRRLASKGPFPSYGEVSKLLDQAEEGDAAAISKIAELRASLEQEVKANDAEDLSFWASVVEPLDKHASSAFGESGDTIGEMTPAYIIPLSSYRQNVVETLRKSWGLSSNEDFEENAIIAHLDSVVARVLLYLTPQEGLPEAPLPLLGGFVMSNAWASFESIQDGLVEVSTWLSCYLEA
jgi:hypothetical protein